MPNEVDDFQKSRAELNDEILNCGHLGIKRFFALDHQAYEAGPLDTRTKELLGLVASTVLRCDDCITYHLGGLHRHPACPPGLCQNERDTSASA